MEFTFNIDGIWEEVLRCGLENVQVTIKYNEED